MPVYTKDELNAMRDKDLKRMAFHEMGLTGLSKKRKNMVVDAIMKAQGPTTKDAKPAAPAAKPEAPKMTGMQFSATSILSKPQAKFGNRNTTTIKVSSGVNSGEFPVVGRTVAEVSDFLREVLNVSKMSTGLVNSNEVASDYVLKEGDVLEFLKPTGKKGC